MPKSLQMDTYSELFMSTYDIVVYDIVSGAQPVYDQHMMLCAPHVHRSTGARTAGYERPSQGSRRCVGAPNFGPGAQPPQPPQPRDAPMMPPVPEDGEGKPVLDENGEERRGVEARGQQGLRMVRGEILGFLHRFLATSVDLVEHPAST